MSFPRLVSRLLIPLLLAVATAAPAATSRAFKAGVFEPPRQAPEFALHGSDGSELTLARFRGKVVGMASASPGGLGGLRAQSHLAPLLLNLQCWLAPVSHAVGPVGQAFDEAGRLQRPQDQLGMKAVLEQVLWAAQRLSA